MKAGLKFWFAFLAVVALFAMLVLVHAARTWARVNNASRTLSDAKTVFEAKCASCHGKDGRGKTFRGKLKHARDLTDAKWQNDVTDERLFNSIHNGRNKMPNFKKDLSEDQIDALVAYVRHFKK
jgi:mono/diheme cytochrome c family protein